MKKYFLLYIFIFLFVNLNGQSIRIKGETWYPNILNYSQDFVKIDNVVYVTCPAGLIKYDLVAKDYKIITLSDTGNFHVKKIAASTDSLFIGSSSGIIIYDLIKGKIVNILNHKNAGIPYHDRFGMEFYFIDMINYDPFDNSLWVKVDRKTVGKIDFSSKRTKSLNEFRNPIDSSNVIYKVIVHSKFIVFKLFGRNDVTYGISIYDKHKKKLVNFDNEFADLYDNTILPCTDVVECENGLLLYVKSQYIFLNCQDLSLRKIDESEIIEVGDLIRINDDLNSSIDTAYIKRFPFLKFTNSFSILKSMPENYPLIVKDNYKMALIQNEIKFFDQTNNLIFAIDSIRTFRNTICKDKFQSLMYTSNGLELFNSRTRTFNLISSNESPFVMQYVRSFFKGNEILFYSAKTGICCFVQTEKAKVFLIDKESGNFTTTQFDHYPIDAGILNDCIALIFYKDSMRVSEDKYLLYNKDGKWIRSENVDEFQSMGVIPKFSWFSIGLKAEEGRIRIDSRGLWIDN
jgi:hypothetical protein